MALCRIRFEPDGVDVLAPSGTTVLEAARNAGLMLASSCGGRGTCGDCAVKIVKGSPASVRSSRGPASLLPAGIVLACQAEVSDGLVVRPLRPLQRT